MRTAKEIEEFISNPKNKARAVLLKQMLFSEELQDISTPECLKLHKEKVDFLTCHVTSLVCTRLALAVLCSGDDIEKLASKIKALENENAELRKRLIPEGV